MYVGVHAYIHVAEKYSTAYKILAITQFTFFF